VPPAGPPQTAGKSEGGVFRQIKGRERSKRGGEPKIRKKGENREGDTVRKNFTA